MKEIHKLSSHHDKPLVGDEVHARLLIGAGLGLGAIVRNTAGGPAGHLSPNSVLLRALSLP